MGSSNNSLITWPETAKYSKRSGSALGEDIMIQQVLAQRPFQFHHIGRAGEGFDFDRNLAWAFFSGQEALAPKSTNKSLAPHFRTNGSCVIVHPSLVSAFLTAL